MPQLLKVYQDFKQYRQQHHQLDSHYDAVKNITTDCLKYESTHYLFTHQKETYHDLNLIKNKTKLENKDQRSIYCTKLFNLSDDLKLDNYQIHLFNQDNHEIKPLETNQIICNDQLHHRHPYLIIENNKEFYLYAVAYSGLVVFNINIKDTHINIEAGITPDNFSYELKPQAKLNGYEAIKVTGTSISDVLNKMHQYLRLNWLNYNKNSENCFVSWHSDQAYRDHEFNEAYMIETINQASKLDIDSIILEYGWFENEFDANQSWPKMGNYHKVDRQRFPLGISYLSDHAHKMGLKFGLYLNLNIINDHFENKSKLNNQDQYLNFASKKGQDAIYLFIANLIEEYALDGIVFDFNHHQIIKQSNHSKNEEFHNRGETTNYYDYYQGLYHVLSKINYKYEHVVLEGMFSCSDLQLMKYLHRQRILVHDKMQTTTVQSLVLPPEVSVSSGYINYENHLNNHNITQDKLRYFLRNNMNSLLALNLPISSLDHKSLTLIRNEIKLYKKIIKPFILGELIIQSNQLFKCHQFINEDCYLLNINSFNQPTHQTIILKNIDVNQKYEIYNIDSKNHAVIPGTILKAGYLVNLNPNQSQLTYIKPKGE